MALGNSAIWDANEAFYVETPREMLEAHDFVNPSFNYLPRFNKPVLSYWIVAGLYKVFGVSVARAALRASRSARCVIIACAFVLARACGSGSDADEDRDRIGHQGSAIGRLYGPRPAWRPPRGW